MIDDRVDCSDSISQRRVNGVHIDTSGWATPDIGALQGEARTQYFSRRQAIVMFLAGVSSEEIKRITSLGGKQAYRLIRERCLEMHSDGRLYGWRGLLRYHRIKAYKRIRPVRPDSFGYGAVGALQSVLDIHPELRQSFNTFILSRSSNTKLKEVKKTRRRACAWFLNELRLRGYEVREEWPFNTLTQGYYGICRYIDSVLDSDPKALADAVGGPDQVKKLTTGDGTNRPVTRFMQRVEMDAHKLDGRFSVSIPQIDGSFIERIVHRLWVIVILEIVSRTVVGYYFCMGKEVTKADVLRAIKSALTKWMARPLTFSDTPYQPGAGLLSTAGDEFIGLCWDETSVDGALAETCKDVRSALKDAVGSTLLEPSNSFAKRRNKDDRPFIETFFRNVAGKGFQRLSNTTGGKVQDKKGRKPEEVALASSFQYEYAMELLDVLIANYNVHKHGGISGQRPLDYARFLYKQGGQNWRHADSDTVQALVSVRKLCTVCGGAIVGRRPYVEFSNARYSNEILESRQDLVGKKIWVICHKEDDCRIAMGSTMEGYSLGVLRAASPWHRSPHSLAVRSAICRASASGRFVLPSGCDAVEVFIAHVEAQPNNKLPVHPAYLEVRRILVTSMEQSIGTSMLEMAKARADVQDVAGSGAPHAAQTITGPACDAVTASSTPSNLPLRRKASTR